MNIIFTKPETTSTLEVNSFSAVISEFHKAFIYAAAIRIAEFALKGMYWSLFL